MIHPGRQASDRGCTGALAMLSPLRFDNFQLAPCRDVLITDDLLLQATRWTCQSTLGEKMLDGLEPAVLAVCRTKTSDESRIITADNDVRRF